MSVIRSPKFLFCVLLTVLLVSGTAWLLLSLAPLPSGLEVTYVGRDSCIACHQEQARSFVGSHHDCAMQVASKATVLGKFDGELLSESGQTARFFTENDQYFVETQGEDGALAVFQIGWTFGITPLQQYMVTIPNSQLVERQSDADELGRVQVLRWCWNVENQEWFHLDPPDVKTTLSHDDELHWTGPAQRWNNTCADCHSTNLQKGFDVKTATYHTTFSEMDVSCESCHGPGSVHIRLADRLIYREDPNYGHGLAALKTSAESQIQACAPCHSRRRTIAAGHHAGKPYDDFYAESLLSEAIYFDDGQVLEEDYVHGSFIQSKMYHKGIRCSDCHDPHTARLKQTGNQVCTSCHQHPSFKYDTPAHHFHESGKAGSFCVDCHMPATTYMEVDSRRDHSLRIPRPDLSVQLGTPNACSGCHLEPTNIAAEKRSQLTQYLDWMIAAKAGDEEVAAELKRADQWCDDACNKWYGDNRQRPYHFATALAAARKNQQDAPEKLNELLRKRGAEAPAIARATALQDLLRLEPHAAVNQALSLRDDPSPLVRSSAASAFIAEPDPGKRLALLRPLFSDSSRSVRVEAARVAVTAAGAIDAFRTAESQRALDELRQSYAIDSDRSAGHFSLGMLEEQLGSTSRAIQHYEDAIRIEPSMAGPRTNLAALLTDLANQQLSNSDLVQSLLGRAKVLREEELGLLERDFGYAPNIAGLAYRLGLAYYLNEEYEKSLTKLQAAAALDPASAEYSIALILLLQKLERYDLGLAEANRFLQLQPENETVKEIKRSLLRY